MRTNDLIAVSGKIYKYNYYDEGIKKHFVSEVGIDEEGNLAFTNCIIHMTDSEISNRGINLTERQWIRLTEYFLKQEYDFSEEEITEIANNIVDSFATARVPLVEELPNYIAIYMM